MFLVAVLVIPTSASAAGLSQDQISSILTILQSFGANQSVVNNVAKSLGSTAAQFSTGVAATSASQTLYLSKPTSSFYPSSGGAYGNTLGGAVEFGFTLSNYGNTDFYISKVPGVALLTSTAGSAGYPASGSSTLNYVVANQETYASDTGSAPYSGSYVIPAGVSRTFTYTGQVDNTNGVAGIRAFKIVQINYGTTASNPTGLSIVSGLSALTVTPNLASDSTNVPVLPSVTIQSPNNGDVWQLGNNNIIRWTYPTVLAGQNNVNVYVSLSNGNSTWDIWHTNTGGLSVSLTPNSGGEVSWSLLNFKDIPSGSYKIEISISDRLGVNYHGFSNSFTVINPNTPTATPLPVKPSPITVTLPRTGSIYDNGSLQNIPVSWNGYQGNFDYYRVFLGNTLSTSVLTNRLAPIQISKYSNSFSFKAGDGVKSFLDNLHGQTLSQIQNGYYVQVDAVKVVPDPYDALGRTTEYAVASGKSVVFTITTSPFSSSTTPAIFSITPTSGPVGTTVVVYGTGFNTTRDNVINISDGQLGVSLKMKSTYGNSLSFTMPVTFAAGKTYMISVDNDLLSNIAYFTVTSVAATITQQALPTLKVAFDQTTPLSGIVQPGERGVVFARIKVTAGPQAVNNMNNIQVGSNLSNADTKLKNIRVLLDGSQIGTVSNLIYNGSYYYGWINVSNISIPAYTSRIFTVIGDVDPLAVGSVNLGIAGWNFVAPGASVDQGGSPSYGNLMQINSSGVVASPAPVAQPYITVTSPSGGPYQAGSLLQVNYSAINFGDLKVNFDLVNQYGAVIRNIGTNLNNSGVYTWIPTADLAGTQWKILVSSADRGPSAQAYSPYFTVTPSYVPTSTTACAASSVSGYSVPAKNSGESVGSTKLISILNGTRSTSKTFTCNNGTFTESFETLNITCNSGYTQTGSGCAAVTPSSNSTSLPAPVISSITPTSGPVGTVVTIVGSGFNTTRDNIVNLTDGQRGVSVSVRSTSGNTLPITIPSTFIAGTTYKLSVDNDLVSNIAYFTVSAQSQATAPAETTTIPRSITVTGPLSSYFGPSPAAVTFTSSGVSRVKIEACVNQTSCTTLASSASVTSSNTSWFWSISGTEAFAGSMGEKQVWLKVTDLDSSISAFAPSYIYIIKPTVSPSGSPISERLDKASLFGAVLKAFSFTAN